jgi:ubiquinone/menaquinone biosynthesis C-methylase UbiE
VTNAPGIDTYPAAWFDRAVSSFVFHHLDAEVKRRALAETRRVLRPGGALALLDFGGAAERPGGLLAHLLHHDEELRDNYGGRLTALLREAGFRDARAAAERRTWLGPVACYTAAAAPGSAEG